MNMDAQVAQNAVSKPMWLDSFLSQTFFVPCSDHEKKNRNNGLKKYCITCDRLACLYCVKAGDHCHHKVLKINKHFYKEVVSRTAMEKYIDCTKIQPYKRNKRMVISLHPLPDSESVFTDEGSCCSCNRKLPNPNLYRFCSISCMGKVVFREDAVIVPEESQAETTPPSAVSFRKRKRKGTPHRAPFF